MTQHARIPPIALALLLFLLPTAPLEAKQGGRLIGKVLSKNGQALMGAVVTIFREEKDGGAIHYTSSDNKGQYQFRDLGPGNYSVHVNLEGYTPLVKSNLEVSPGKATTLNVILLDLMELLSSDDPRNWGIATVMRSTSSRRLIFRAGEDDSGDLGERAEHRFDRNGAVNLTSSPELSSGYSGIVSNFAYSEPITQSGRMIFSGQLSSGSDSFWRVQNIFQYQPQDGRDVRFSLGYGRQNLTATTLSSMTGPAGFFSLDPVQRDAGVETLALGMTARDQVLDAFSVEYGFDLTRVHSGATRSILSPHFRLVLTPASGWLLKGSMASRRFSDANSVILPDGEFINLAEPVYLARINGRLHLSQFKHYELGIEKLLGPNGAVAMSLYRDRMIGPGLPFMVSVEGAEGMSPRVMQLDESQTEQQGMKVGYSRSFLDLVAGSVNYIYGTGYAAADSPVPAGALRIAEDIPIYVQRSYLHALTGTLNSRISRTSTELMAVVRWYPGDFLTPIDLFSDRMEMGTKGFAFRIRQPIPMPDFIVNAGEWVALVDVRNLFEQGGRIIRTPDGDIILAPNPRAFRFGLNLRFN